MPKLIALLGSGLNRVLALIFARRLARFEALMAAFQQLMADFKAGRLQPDPIPEPAPPRARKPNTPKPAPSAARRPSPRRTPKRPDSVQRVAESGVDTPTPFPDSIPESHPFTPLAPPYFFKTRTGPQRRLTP